MVIQAVVDYKYRFIYVYSGSVNDAHVFAHSSIYHCGKNGTLLPSPNRNIGGRDIPLYLVGDQAYPLLTWSMKPFHITVIYLLIREATTTIGQELELSWRMHLAT